MEAKHIKTGKIYKFVTNNITNCTNANEGQRMALYQDKESGQLFVRDWDEFQEKFELTPTNLINESSRPPTPTTEWSPAPEEL